MLSLGCITFLFLMGLLSYKINNSSYAYFTDKVQGKETIEMTYVKPNLDKSGANAPLISDNMIPVYYDESGDVWRKADVTNEDKNYKWYDYDNKIWANAVTVTETNRSTYLSANAGTEIPMSDINTMWVWIPRYTYTYFSSSTPAEIQIKFEDGVSSSGTISCSDVLYQTDSDGNAISEKCIDSLGNLVVGTSTYTHPAFTFGSEELTGIWVGKFEVSSNISCTPVSYRSVGEFCNLRTIRPKIVPNVYSWRGASASTFYYDIYDMRESGNQYGFNANDEVHMMKNMEWGAVTYLYHSKYGRCTDGVCTEVQVNSYYKSIYDSTNAIHFKYMKTGCGPQADGSTSYDEVCNEYNTVLGKLASTTGNVYGIYDMSGGSYDSVMGNTVDHSSTYGVFYSSSSEFTTAPGKKYYDQYNYGDSQYDSSRGKLGDATKETYNWYKDDHSFPWSNASWFNRGGLYGNGTSNGLFNYSRYTACAEDYISTRAVISNLK